MRIGLSEAFLLQFIGYSIIYFINSYIGFLLCLVISVIAAAILIIASISELVERSKVPASYYTYMVTAILSPIVVLALFSLFDPTSFDWLNE